MDMHAILTIVVTVLIIVFFIGMFKEARFHKKKKALHKEVINTYGEPAKSLYISTRVFSLHQDTDITDDNDNVIYHSKTKFWTLHDRTEITNVNGVFVSKMHSKLFSFHERRYITMANGVEFQLSNELWHIIKDITDIEGLDWKLEGNILGLNFTIKDDEGHILAYVGQKVLSMHDMYSIDIYDVSKEAEIVTIVIGLQHMMRDRAVASSSASSSSSN